jgi:putative acyl-CoA dehydrogenase
MCLDVLRALSREPRMPEVVGELLAPARGRDARYDRFVAALEDDLADAADGELRARDMTQRLALAVQAALLLVHGPAASCEAFLASRLAAGPPSAFGTLPRGLDPEALITRVFS